MQKQIKNKQAANKAAQWAALLLSIFLFPMLNKATAAEALSAVVQHEVLISGFAFEPAQITVAIGDSVTWINNDVVPHNIATSDSHSLLSPTLQKGQRFSMKITASLAYLCGLHPSMAGAIVISDTATSMPNQAQ